MDSRDSVFDGKVILSVKDTEHLARIIEKIKRIPGIHSVERFVG